MMLLKVLTAGAKKYPPPVGITQSSKFNPSEVIFVSVIPSLDFLRM